MSHVYDKVLPTLGKSLAVYGWSFSENDGHILRALGRGAIKYLAISVHKNNPNADQFCDRVLKKVKANLREVNVTFFDSASHGCWVNPAA